MGVKVLVNQLLCSGVRAASRLVSPKGLSLLGEASLAELIPVLDSLTHFLLLHMGLPSLQQGPDLICDIQHTRQPQA